LGLLSQDIPHPRVVLGAHPDRLVSQWPEGKDGVVTSAGP